MTTIAVKPTYSWEELISVKVNDECNHAGAEETTGDYQIAIDDTKPMPILECRCGAYQWGHNEQDEDGLTSVEYSGEWLT